MALIDNLLAWYALDGDTNDSSTNALHATSSGDLGFFAGKISLAAENNEASANPPRIILSSINLGTSWSIHMWINTAGESSYATGALVDGNFGLFFSGFKPNFYYSSDHLTTASIASGTWTQVIVTYDGTTLRFYVNGTADNTFTISIPNYSPISLMRDVSGLYPLNGSTRIDEVAFWTRPLSGAEVTELYNGGAGLSYDDVDGTPIDVTSISPDSGDVAGGTPVSIGGVGFVDGADVTIGGNPATSVVFVDDTEITAVTPAGVAGPADVVVTNPDTTFDTLTDGFLYTEPAPPPAESPIANLRFTETGMRFANVNDGRADHVTVLNGQVWSDNRVEPLSFDTIDKLRVDGRYSGAIKFRFRDYRKRRGNTFG